MTKIMSETRLVYDVLVSGQLVVPWHQRYYDWKAEHVDALVADLKYAFEKRRPCYFLGSIMLVGSRNTATPKIINDGQQRLITFSLILAKLCRVFSHWQVSDRNRQSMVMRALFDLPATTDAPLHDAPMYRPRITPPRNDKSKYEQLIRGHDIGTNGSLTEAWNRITSSISKMNNSAAVDFFDFLTQHVEISVLTIPNDVDANSVFEALNARGKPLDSVDLIRNRLYSYFSESKDEPRRDTIHDDLERIAVIGRTSGKTREYYRCYLQCCYGYIKKAQFYRETRRHIETATNSINASNYVYELIQNLGNSSSIELFRTITSSTPNPHLDLSSLPTIRRKKRNLTVLLKELHPYKVSHPILYALLHRYISASNPGKRSEIEKIVSHSIQNINSLVMRTTLLVPKFEPSKFEDTFANCAKNIFVGRSINSLRIFSALEKIDRYGVMDNKKFIRQLAEMNLYDIQKIKRLLLSINTYRETHSNITPDEKCSVECILPKSESHWRNWTDFTDVDASECLHRIGNMTIVAADENRLATKEKQIFDAKRTIYATSAMQITREISTSYTKWTPATINERSYELAREAAKIWKFNVGS